MSRKKETVAPVQLARLELSASVAKAAGVLVGLLDSENEALRYKAALALLNRAGLTEAERNPIWCATAEVGGQERDLLDV